MCDYKLMPFLATLLFLILFFSNPSYAAGPTIRICSIDANGARGTAWTLNGAAATGLRSKILNASFFSPNGIEPTTFTIFDGYGASGSITAASLASNGCEVFFKGYIQDTNITTAERNAIFDWVNSTGGTLLSFADSGSFNAFATRFGHSTANSDATSWTATATGLVHPIFDGPFGSGSVLNTVELKTYYTNTTGADILATETSNTSRATLLDRAVGNGHAVFAGDIDMVTRGISSGSGNNTDQDHITLNLFAYAANTYNDNNYTPADPVITAPVDGSTSGDNTPTVSGTADPGVTITVTGPNGETCTTTADFNTGAWSCDIAPALTDGNNTITAVATFGNNSSGNDSIILNVDTTAPTAAVCTVEPNPANNGTALTATCTGVETGGSVSIPGYTCAAESGNTVVCTGTAGNGPGQVSGDATATTADAAGNTATSDAAFTLDNTAPSAAVCAVNPNPANNGTALTATCTGVETGGSVTIPGYSCGAEAGGTVTCSATAGNGPGQVSGDATATTSDAAGNTATSNAAFTLDNTAPTIAQCTVDPDPANNGTAVTATCTGVEAGATVTIPGYTCGAEAGGTVTCTGTVGQAGVDGDEVATATDAAGNTATTPAGFTLDNSAPAAAVCTVTPNPANDGTALTATCTGVETGATVTIPNYSCGTESGNQVVCTATAGTGGVTGDETATTSDAAGNSNTSDVPFTLDNTPPTITACVVSPDPANNGTALTATCSGVETGATVTIPGYVCAAESGNEVTCTATAGQGGVDGTETATATDTAGNTATTPATFTLDNTEPAIGTCTVSPDPANDGTVVTASCTGVEAGSTLTIPGYACTDNGSGNWSCTATVGVGGVDGDEEATATDEAGNTASTPAAFTLDNVAPPAPGINTPTNGAPVTGTGEPGATVTVTTPSGSTCTAVVQPNGTWSCPLVPAPVDGEDITATQEDEAGNTSPPTTVTGAIDTTAPSAPVINPVNENTDPITGTAEPGTVIDLTGVTCDNEPVITNVNGQWTCETTNSVPLTVGDIIIATATDDAGNVSQPASTTVGDSATQSVAPTINPVANGANLITGTAVAGSTINLDGITCNNSPVTADANGMWICESPNPVPVTDDIIMVTATQAGLAASPEVSTTVYDPATTSPPAPQVNPTDGDPVTGTTIPNGVITVIGANGQELCTTTADAAGNFSCSPVIPTPVDGDVLSVIVTDGNGNSSLPTEVTVDAVAPGAAVCTVTPDPANDGTALTATCTGVETDAVVTIPGYTCGTESGNEVTCTATAGQNGVDGDEEATITDAAGNFSLADVFFTLDNVAPGIAQCTVTPDPAQTGTTVTAICEGVETGATVTIPGYVCGAEANNEVTCTATAGQNGVDGDEVATVTDAAGNTANTPASFTLDDTAPVGAVCTVTPDPASTGTSLTATCTGVETDATVTIPGYTCGVESGNEVICTATAGQGGVDGEETASITDAAGNTATTPAAFTLDDTAPVGAVCTVTPDPASTGTALTATCNGVETGATVTIPGYSCGVETGNVVTCTATAGQNGVDGDETATITDVAGNSATTPATFTLDDSAPAAPTFTSPTSGLTAAGTGEPGATVTVDTVSGATCQTEVLADGSWSCELSPEPVDGETATATQTDAAGNQSGIAVATVSYRPDLSSFITNCVAGVKPEQSLLYSVTIMNAGNIDIINAQVSTDLGNQISSPAWTCDGTNGAICGNASGNGDLNELVDLPAGSGLVYLFDTTVTGALFNFVDVETTVTMPMGTTDVNLNDNTTFDSDLIYQFIFKDGFECAAPGTIDSSNKMLESLLNR